MTLMNFSMIWSFFLFSLHSSGVWTFMRDHIRPFIPISWFLLNPEFRRSNSQGSAIPVAAGIRPQHEPTFNKVVVFLQFTETQLGMQVLGSTYPVTKQHRSTKKWRVCLRMSISIETHINILATNPAGIPVLVQNQLNRPILYLPNASYPHR